MIYNNTIYIKRVSSQEAGVAWVWVGYACYVRSYCFINIDIIYVCIKLNSLLWRTLINVENVSEVI